MDQTCPVPHIDPLDRPTVRANRDLSRQNQFSNGCNVRYWHDVGLAEGIIDVLFISIFKI